MTRRSALGLAATVTLALLLAATVALTACRTQVAGNGVPGTVTRTLPPFDGVAISLGIITSITLGAPDQVVTLSGDANLLQYVELVVEHGVLVTRLTGTSSIDPVIPLRLQLSVPQPPPAGTVGPFSSIDVSGKSSVDLNRAAGAPSDVVLSVTASDSSQVQLDGGGGDQLEASISGASRLYAAGYDAASAGFVVSGSSTAQIQAGAILGGSPSTVSGASHVELSGGAPCAGVTVDASSSCVQK